MGGVHASLKDPEGDLARAAAARVPVMLLQVCVVFRHDCPPMWHVNGMCMA